MTARQLITEGARKKTTLLISAGEASGEHYGGQLVTALQRAFLHHGSAGGEFESFGMGGEQMRAAGCEIVVESRDVAVVGLSEVLTHLPRIYGKFHHLLREADRRMPDAAVLIDFPDFNLRLAKQLHARGIPVIYFVSPQLWAWRQSRIRQVRKYVKKMLVIFPFEEEFYGKHGVAAEYVGHPLADPRPPIPSREGFAAANGLDASRQWIALLPGSRRQEVERHIGAMLEAAAQMPEEFQFLLPVASTLDLGWMQAKITDAMAEKLQPRLRLNRDARASLGHARASVVASGTATVEAALAGNPFVMVYRVSAATWLLGRRMVKLPHFAMVNLIAGKRIVPELVQQDFTAEKVVAVLRKLVAEGAERQQMMSDLGVVAGRLRPSASSAAERAAQSVLAALTAPKR